MAKHKTAQSKDVMMKQNKGMGKGMPMTTKKCTVHSKDMPTRQMK